MNDVSKFLLNLRLSRLNILLFCITGILTISTAFTYAANIYEESLHSDYEQRLASVPQIEQQIQKEVAETEELRESLSYIFAINDKIQEVSRGRLDNEKTLHYSFVIAEEADRYDIDPMLVLAIIAAESSFRKDVVSHKGAVGLMQLLPSTAFYISDKTEHINISDAEELFDEETNLRLGVAYLAYLLKKTGSTEHAVIAYNYGPANLRRAISSNSQLPKKYVRTVMNYYKQITKDSES